MFGIANFEGMACPITISTKLIGQPSATTYGRCFVTPANGWASFVCGGGQHFVVFKINDRDGLLLFMLYNHREHSID